MKSLTKREQEIFEFMKTFEKLGNTSIDNLCKNLKIGYATIYSIIDKLGFNGYKDMVINLSSTHLEKSESLTEDYIDVVNANFSSEINQHAVDFCELIKNKHITLIGKSHSNIIAKKFSFDLNRLGFQSNVIDNDYDQIMLSISNMKNDNILIAITNSGKTDWILDALIEANKRNITCITITSSVSPKIKSLSKLVVKLVNGANFSSTAKVSNFLPVLIFLDIVWQKVLTTQ